MLVNISKDQEKAIIAVANDISDTLLAFGDDFAEDLRIIDENTSDETALDRALAVIELFGSELLSGSIEAKN